MRKLNRLLTVVGAALLMGLLAVGTVTVAGPPPGPPEPPPRITPAQIIDGVNRLLPHTKPYRPGDPGFDILLPN